MINPFLLDMEPLLSLKQTYGFLFLRALMMRIDIKTTQPKTNLEY